MTVMKIEINKLPKDEMDLIFSFTSLYSEIISTLGCKGDITIDSEDIKLQPIDKINNGYIYIKGYDDVYSSPYLYNIETSEMYRLILSQEDDKSFSIISSLSNTKEICIKSSSTYELEPASHRMKIKHRINKKFCIVSFDKITDIEKNKMMRIKIEEELNAGKITSKNYLAKFISTSNDYEKDELFDLAIRSFSSLASLNSENKHGLRSFLIRYILEKYQEDTIDNKVLLEMTHKVNKIIKGCRLDYGFLNLWDENNEKMNLYLNEYFGEEFMYMYNTYPELKTFINYLKNIRRNFKERSLPSVDLHAFKVISNENFRFLEKIEDKKEYDRVRNFIINEIIAGCIYNSRLDVIIEDAFRILENLHLTHEEALEFILKDIDNGLKTNKTTLNSIKNKSRFMKLLKDENVNITNSKFKEIKKFMLNNSI